MCTQDLSDVVPAVNAGRKLQLSDRGECHSADSMMALDPNKSREHTVTVTHCFRNVLRGDCRACTIITPGPERLNVNAPSRRPPLQISLARGLCIQADLTQRGTEIVSQLEIRLWV